VTRELTEAAAPRHPNLECADLSALFVLPPGGTKADESPRSKKGVDIDRLLCRIRAIHDTSGFVSADLLGDPA